ncbi:sulfate adenylyltransferase subunit 1 [Blattabacterium sp. (Blattella germanica) str. Bge]|uniref:sulfate adenylyltransferase subunit 1 n=1 Tax=Blattabacterium sp. (Blattella germanica) TaxID=624186 RepID=UPI0001BB615E|nr:GTP-binding protein [Blattabacterium sp. (Blattella germanica)]ACY40296.1 sulfate adenylyltransferase subunit 1 [Blattabacterium sp. (Blattella germanica) str. Bge]
MDTLRFMTSGSVDNGKSTLIGRLLYDSHSILVDQLSIVAEKSIKKYGNNQVKKIDLSLFTDGLKAEREQGITIDVAYKYFSTSKRKFIIADAPGHVQYTRNMVTGASHVDLAIVLIDACYGVVEQTQRHSLILGMLNVPKIILAVNKMDLINYDYRIYKAIVSQYQVIARRVGLDNLDMIPISAKNGDNVVDKSSHMKWYDGPSLLSLLENIVIQKNTYLSASRYPVQYVIRSSHNLSRGYAGKIISGIYRKGDEVIVYPSKNHTIIKHMEIGETKIKEGFSPQSIVMYLEDEIDVSRGDLIVKKDDNLPIFSQEFEMILCWMSNKLLKVGNKYLFQIHSFQASVRIKNIAYRIDVNTLKRENTPDHAILNDLVKVKVKTSVPVPHDPYKKIKENGSCILIDETSYSTVAACMIQ